jgi:uncharacterized membrane protein YphA (DoxX/SURF4 family)
MMKLMKSHLKVLLVSPWPYRVIRVALAGLFIFGGGIKLLDPKAFAATISVYGLVPEPLLPFVAIGLPLIEVLAGVGLLFDIRGSLTAISGLLVLFIFVLWYGILNDLDVDCGCFGPEDLANQGQLWNAFYRDLFLVGLVAPFLYFSRWMRAQSAIQQNVTEINDERRK